MSPKFWKEYFLPIFEILVNLAFGFFFFFTLEISSEIPIRWGEFVFPYPEILLVSLLGLFLSYSLKGLSKTNPSKIGFLLVLLASLGISAYLLFYQERPLLLETIFYKWELYIVFFLIFLGLGYYSFHLQDANRGGFLIGVFSYSVLQYFIQFNVDNYKTYLIIFLGLASLSIMIRVFLELPNQFVPRRLSRKDFKLYGAIYSSYLILFIIHISITALRGFDSVFISIFLFFLTYLMARALSIYGLDEIHYRKSIVYGRNILSVCFILMAASFSFDAIGMFLFFILGGVLGFYRPNTSRYKNQLSIFILSILSVLILLAVIQLAKLQFYWIHSLVVLVFLIFYPFLKVASMNPLSRHVPIVIAISLSIFFFKPPVVHTISSMPKKSIFGSEPIAYLLSNLMENEDRYIYIQSGLPKDSPEDYPSLEELNNHIPIIGDNPSDSLVAYYRNYVIQKSIPHYTIQSGNVLNMSLLDSMKYVQYPGFIIYYSHDELQPNWNREFTMDWKFRYIIDKLNESPDFKSHPGILNKIEAYGSYEIKKETTRYRSIVQESIRNYCEFYLRNSLYADALNCYLLEQSFGDLGEDSIRNSYDLLSYTTPGINHIPLLERLAQIQDYKLPINKKIYPIYISMNMYNDAVRVLENLIDIAQKEGNEEEKNSLELEWIRSLLEADKLEKAYPIILSSLRKDPDSILWNRLLRDFEEKREARRRIWSPPPTVDTTGIE